MDLLVLMLFCASLLLCVCMDLSILYALGIGLFLFLGYGRKKGYAWSELIGMAFSGIKTVRNILITFFLIGMLTALWRGSGTIAAIVSYASVVIRPSVFLVMTFLLNCLVSVLTGTAFGTAATMGVICATMAAAMGVDPVLTGGAVLSGVYFGDRCSPVSTSALLVAEITGTNIFQNIKNMLQTALVPFLLTCAVYTGIGLLNQSTQEVPDLQAMFSREFSLHWITLLPAIVILLLSLKQVNVKFAMTASIVTAIPICILYQELSIEKLPEVMLRGYYAQDPEVAVMLNGGGIFSMLKVAAIVCLSSSYSGIFQKTGLLDRARQAIERLAMRATPFAATVLTSIVTGMIACNQTLTIMLTNQLCKQEQENNNEEFAVVLEDTAVVIAPLIPWSIAGAVPLASVGAPTQSICFACFLYLLPMWRLALEIRWKLKNKRAVDR